MKRIIVVWLVMMVLIGGMIGIVSTVDGAAEVKPESAGKTLSSHSPIYIDGNSDFASQASSEGWAGDGAEGNQYVIENWDINASITHGIYIINTDVYFIIRNCYIHGSNSYHGVFFGNVINGKLENVTSYNNYDGIRLYCSSNNNITNCNIYNNSYGIFLHYSSDNTITNCTVYNNAYGIDLWWDSSNNNIINCYVYNNDNGIHLHSNSVRSSVAADFDYSSENLTDSDGVQFNLTSGIVLEEPEVNGSQVALKWSTSGALCFAAYIIFRATHPNVTAYDTYVEEFLTVHTTSYVDTIPGPGTYYYRIYEQDLVFDLETYVCVGSNEESVTFYPNLIYNNYFNNTINAYDDGNNIWSITKTEGTNIIGGSYLGGNYWSDYAGVDMDGDGLGDTPYNILGGSNKDCLPLVMSPEENISLTNLTIVNLTYLNISYAVNITNLSIINISYINITNLMTISNVSFANVFEVNLTNFTYMSSCSFINVSYINITQSMNINNLTFNNVSYVYLQNVTNVNFVITAISNITTIAYEDLQIVIPAEALTLSMPFNLSTTSASLPPGYNVVGDIYKIECGVSISAPINITLSYAGIVLPSGISEDDLAIYKKVGDNWIKIDSTIDKLNDTVSVQVTSFSNYAILYKQPSTEGEEEGEPIGYPSEFPWLYIIVSIIIIVVLAVVGISIRRRKKASPPQPPSQQSP